MRGVLDKRPRKEPWPFFGESDRWLTRRMVKPIFGSVEKLDSREKNELEGEGDQRVTVEFGLS